MAELKERRDAVLNYAASRYGQTSLSGLEVPPEMMKAIEKDVDAWNGMFGDIAPITGKDVTARALARQRGALMTLRERMIKGVSPRMRGTFASEATRRSLPGALGLPLEVPPEDVGE
jgi:hypothetical protein